VLRYKEKIEPWAPPEFQFSRDDIMWGFNTLVTCGWGNVRNKLRVLYKKFLSR
jgi:hypothetical protein